MYFAKRFVSVAMAVITCLGMSVFASAAKTTYNDINEITSHVKLNVPNVLNIVRPSEDIATSEATYFITGTSNPDQPLTVNGQTVTTRGARGSFGVYVSLNTGANTFTFKQSGASESVTITRGGSGSGASTISIVRAMSPSYDFAITGGSASALTCEAPSGASVVATVGGQNIKMTQRAQAAAGVPATFQGNFTSPTQSTTKNLGKVSYTMTYNGKTTSYQSAGNLFVAGEQLVVQVINNAASIYDDEKHSYYYSVGRPGAVDYVTQITASHYQLASGGWIPHESAAPLEGNIAVRNKVSEVDYSIAGDGETTVLTGTSNPMFRVNQTAKSLVVHLANTTGVTKPDISDSRLFSSVSVSESNGETVLEFALSGDRGLWGYDISYKSGVTRIYAKYRPTLQSGNQPLKGITIVVDPGHGGKDPGALGVTGQTGAVESEINYATAVAVQKRLESLGATVVMTRSGDQEVSLNERMDVTQGVHADLFIAVHSNSIGFAGDSNKAKGTEGYYYDAISQKFATAVVNNVAANTGRTNRGARQSNYRVTMNSFCPSVLVELGFVTNPAEYDELTTKSSIFKTANAIGDAAITALA